jgi:hypothetical protein
LLECEEYNSKKFLPFYFSAIFVSLNLPLIFMAAGQLLRFVAKSLPVGNIVEKKRRAIPFISSVIQAFSFVYSQLQRGKIKSNKSFHNGRLSTHFF